MHKHASTVRTRLDYGQGGRRLAKRDELTSPARDNRLSPTVPAAQSEVRYATAYSNYRQA